MDIIHSIAVARTIFILAIVNLATGVLIFFSCRCIPGMAWGQQLMQLFWFRRFYRFHCYIWWVFWLSVVAHAVLALLFMGLPF
jgi:hypothetical protein